MKSRFDPEPQFLSMLDACGGNPGLLALHLRAPWPTGHSEIGIPPVAPHSACAAYPEVAELLRPNSSDVQQVLDAASTFEGTFTLEAVSGHLRWSDIEFMPAVREAQLAELIASRDNVFAFTHPIHRQALAHSLLDSELNHGARQRSLRVDADEHAPGTEFGADGVKSSPSERHDGAVQKAALHSAVKQLSATSPAAAADLLLTVLDDIVPGQRGNLDELTLTIELFTRAKQFDRACSLAQEAIDSGEPAVSHVPLLAALAAAHQRAGRPLRAIHAANLALQSPQLEPVDRAEVLTIGAEAYLATGQVGVANRWASDAIDASEPLAPALHGLALSVRSGVHSAGGDLELAWQEAEAASELTVGIRTSVPGFRALLRVVQSLASLDRSVDTSPFATLGDIADCEQQALYGACIAPVLVEVGRLDAARIEAEIGLRAALSAPGYAAIAAELHVTLARIALHAGRIEQAGEHFACSRESSEHADGWAKPTQYDFAVALYLEAGGNPSIAPASYEALDRYEDQHELSRLLLANPASAAALVQLRACTEAGPTPRSVVITARRLARRNSGTPSLAAAALHAEGIMNGDPMLLERASLGYEQASRPLGQARALEDAWSARTLGNDDPHDVTLLASAEQLVASGGRCK